MNPSVADEMTANGGTLPTRDAPGLPGGRDLPV